MPLESEKAHEAYEQGLQILRNYGSSTFVRENPDFLRFKDGFAAVTRFLESRPAMLVNDLASYQQMMDLTIAEVFEAHAAIFENDLEHLLEEMGDVGFFGLLTGVLFWDKLPNVLQNTVVESIKWADNVLAEKGAGLNQAIKCVAEGKDTINFPEAFYQLLKSESVDSVRKRAPKIRKIHKELRELINGDLGTDNVAKALAVYWINKSTKDNIITVNLIEDLFAIAGINLIATLEADE